MSSMRRDDDDTFFSGSLILVLTDNAIINPTVLKLPRKEFYGDLLGTNGQREPKYNNCCDVNVHHDPKLLTVEK